MTILKRRDAVILAAMAVLVSACGGGDDAELSANQKAYEAVTLAPNASFMMHWRMPDTAAPQANAGYYLYSDSGSLAASPLNSSAQTVNQSAPVNLTDTLTVPALAPTRVLKGGAILTVPAASVTNKVSYNGGDIRVDTLAADKTTVAYSEIRSNVETVALTGTIGSAPADFTRFHNALFTNTAVLNTAATWAAGSAYLKFTQNNLGDRYVVFDCNGTLASGEPSTCTAGTLNAVMTAGIVSNSDGKTYKLADGAVSTVDGIPMWVASAPRPTSATLTATVQYRVYFEKGGQIYTGALIKDGALLGGGSYVSNPSGVTPVDRLTFLTFDLRLNKAAHDSMAAAVKL